MIEPISDDKNTNNASFVSFVDDRLISQGCLEAVIKNTKQELGDRDAYQDVYIFNCQDSQIIEIDLRGNLSDVEAKMPYIIQSVQQQKKGATNRSDETSHLRAKNPSRGRPKMGVQSKEVTLLPRHWEWLKAQPGGASATLRKLVDVARRESGEGDLESRKQAAYQFMNVIAGNKPGYEEALRALYAGNKVDFDTHIASWPTDIRQYLDKLLETYFV